MPSLSTVPSSSSSSTAGHNSDPIPDNLPPEKDPRNSIVLAVLWVPAFFYFVFKVSIGTLFGVISYEILIVRVSWLQSMLLLFLMKITSTSGVKNLSGWTSSGSRNFWMIRNVRVGRNDRKCKSLEEFKERERRVHYPAMKVFLSFVVCVWNLLENWMSFSLLS